MRVWRRSEAGTLVSMFFFVISGYLISRIILSEERAGSFSLADFYLRRVRRIVPVLFFISLICVPFAWLWFYANQLIDFSKSLIAVLTFSSNIFFGVGRGILMHQMS